MQPEAVLKNLGLTDYEVKAYLALLKLGLATAENISEVGNIPLPRVYDTLEELKNKGFVLISKTRPKRFKPLSVDKALKNLIDVRKSEDDHKLKELEQATKVAIGALINVEKIEIPEEGWDVWSTERRTNITKMLDEQRKMAKKEVLVFSGDMSWIYEISSMVMDLRKRGIEIKAIVSDPKESKDLKQVIKNINAGKKLGIKVKTGYPGVVRGHVIDGKIAAINVVMSKEGLNMPQEGLPGNDFSRKYEMIVSNNPVLVSVFKENFQFWWKTLR